MKKDLLELFQSYGTATLELLPKLLVAIVVFTLFYLAGMLLARIIKRKKRKRDVQLLVKFGGQIGRWSLILIGFMVSMHIMGFGGVMSNLIAGAGISAIILGFAFKDIAENFLAGILLAAKPPFKVGDLVEVDGYKGKVTNLNLRTMHLRVADGRDIYIPTAMIIKTAVTNYTQDGLLRVDFPIGLDTGADVDEAVRLILEELKKFERILPTPAPNVLIEALDVSTINLRVLFWVDQFSTPDANGTGLGIKSQVIVATRDLLFAHGYTMPATILEHKIYQEEAPIPLRIVNSGDGK